MIFQHPFTMTVSGPTSCGKTTWVKTLLDNCNILINPKPTRIIWLYRRWQGLYDELKNTVWPHIEFIQGIPAELADDAFISPRENNIIVLDDLMSTASKDSRITDLFTEYSHYRNLSVLILNQNLYHSKDPTQRRNCHYLTLFNNPIDKQPIMTLARQMYPENSQTFMQIFNQATQKPYGYLVVDLKPITRESDRLRPNILENIGELPINRYEEPLPNHWSFDQQTEHIVQPNCDAMDTTRPIMDKLCCIDCGTLFASTSHLQIHAKRGCPEVHARDVDQLLKRCKYEQNSGSTFESEEERREKSRRWVTLESDGSDKKGDQSSDDDSDMDEEEKGFGLLVQKSYDNYDALYQEKAGELLETMAEAHAEKEAYNMLRTKYKTNLIKEYKFFLYLTDLLKNSPTHQAITDAINEYDQDAYDYKDIVDQGIKDKKYLFDELLDKFNEDTTSSESDSEDESEHDD